MALVMRKGHTELASYVLVKQTLFMPVPIDLLYSGTCYLYIFSAFSHIKGTFLGMFYGKYFWLFA